MRFVILGSGGIGGVIGGRLFQARHEVALIARGAHLERIRASGLRLEDPDAVAQLPIPAFAHPGELTYRRDDVVILATKAQDAVAALDDLRSVAPPSTAVCCATNGVEVERMALRRFSAVYAMHVMMPTAYLEPGVVQVICAPISGGLDLGCYPTGVDDRARHVAGALAASTFMSEAKAAIMRFKYRKLVLNTDNAVEAACRPGDASKELGRRAADEAESVYVAAGIDVATADEEAGRRALMKYRPIGGKRRGGGSTWQSIVRGGSVETDYLNGEIVLIGRTHGVPTPVNGLLQQVMFDLSRRGDPPGSLDAAALLARLDSSGFP